MAGEASVPTEFSAQKEIRESADPIVLMLGPFSNTTAVDQIVPFLTDRDLIVDSVHLICLVKTSDNGSDFNILKAIPTVTTEDTLAEVVTAARDVTETYDLNDLTNGVPYKMALSADNNLIEAGNMLVLNFTGSNTALANLCICIRGRLRRLA